MADLNNAAIDLFYKLRNRFPKITMGDEMSVATIDPEAARFFNFIYHDKESGRDYGRITCSLVDRNGLKVFFDNAIAERMLPEDKNYWYRFLKELRRYAKSHMLNFDVRDINKDTLSRKDYEFLTKTNPEKKKMKESLEESRVMWHRKGKVSEGNLNNVRIHVVHNERMLENPNNRLLKVDRIFLVNESGEKFLLPFKSVSGAKAMANHVSRGGNPYDSNGQIISRAVNEMRNLGRFASATRTRTFEAAEANNVIRAAQTVKENLKRHLNRLSNNSRSFNESLEALAEFLGEQVDDVTEVKAWFTQQTYNENLDNYLASAAGAYKRLRENTMNKLDEVSDSVKNKILDPKFKLLLKADAGLDKLMTSRSYTDSKAMAVAILGDIANRLIAPDSDDVANFAALMGDLMSSEGEAFGQKKGDAEYDSDKKLAILLAQKYLKELNLIKQKPELESQYRKDINRKPEKIKGKKTESEIFAEEIMGIGEDNMGASVEDITDAISHRLMNSGAANKMLRAHGLDKVLDAIHNVAQDHVGAEELGTSDISIMVKQVMQSLGMREDAVKESGLQYYTGKKKYGKDGMAALAKAGREGASQEELGKIKDKYIKKEDAVNESPMTTPVEINGKQVDVHSLEVVIPDTTDYPDFSDAHFASGQYTDGTPIDDQDLDDLARTHGDLLHVMAHDQFNSMDYNESVDEAGINLGGKIGAGALALGLGATAAGMMPDDKAVPYMVKPGSHGGYEVVLKRNPSHELVNFDDKEQAYAWIKQKMQPKTKIDPFEDAVTEEPNEGNEFSGALAAAKASGKKEFEVDGKTYPVKETTAKKEKKETPMKNKNIEEMRKLAGLPLMENYVYAQEDDMEDMQKQSDAGEPSADDKAEYDQEGRMGKNRLATIKDAATELEKMLQDDENLPEWVQDKITMAADYIDTVRDYMKSNDVEYTDEAHVEEAKKEKPDYLDFDKDGDKEESMKKALADKKKMKESADLTWLQAVAGIKSK